VSPCPCRVGAPTILAGHAAELKPTSRHSKRLLRRRLQQLPDRRLSERVRRRRGRQKGMPVKQNRSSAARERQERGAATVILPDGLPVVHRDLIINLANRARMPAIYPFRTFAVSGDLLSWGTNFSEVYRQAAT
jgi:hypothetical protein